MDELQSKFLLNTDAEPSSVSRHGRVRKKNSLLAEYDSLDSLDKPRKKYEKEKTPRKEKGPGTPKVTELFIIIYI